MDFKHRVISQLNNEKDLILSASDYFKEPSCAIESAVHFIIDATINALNFQCEHNKKTDEIFKIGRECAFLKFSTLFSADFHIVEKGRGINSEIFGVTLVDTIDDIARQAQVRNKTVNFLMASITPAILSVLHVISEEEQYNNADLCNYLKVTSGNKSSIVKKMLN
ncbi:hypothetical protein [Niabella hibiscisoli]|uniref:hypothetical protein n=1 Tax=Niabella hibiscisoli TaxID=1825928 RepID=UPI001F0DA94D|nr:hypothetical protein [Niabella hibiscisoli]MCH5715308.1 hypothetical protein [Niabella hibiscisoli]